jgi:hypothetical protein
MTTDDPHFDREWQRQEAGQDAGYRAVLRALKEPLPIDLPADFAAQLARRAIQPPSPWFEALLLPAAAALFGLALLFMHRLTRGGLTPLAWPAGAESEAALWVLLALLALPVVAWPSLTSRFWKGTGR